MNKNMNKVKLFEYSKIIGKENISFGEYIIIDDFTFIYAKNSMIIGNYVHIAAFTSIVVREKIVLEDFVNISHGCRIFSCSDDFKNKGFGNPTIDDRFRNIFSCPIIIKKFAIIGANSVILPGITIGEGVAVGANSVISKDLEPWGIYINNKKVGERNKEEIMKNYELFLNSQVSERVGKLFK